MLKTLSSFLRRLMLLWLERPFSTWECIGWLLARKMGFSVTTLHRFPEIGWLVKLVVGITLLKSKDKTERLLGKWLLMVTEFPPVREENVMVEGYLAPSVVALYRRSWKHPPLRRQFDRLCETLRLK